MAYQPINFLNAPSADYSGISSIPEHLAKGFNLAQMPTEAKTKLLAQKLNEMRLAQEPEKFAADLDLTKAQTQNALLGQQQHALELARMKKFQELLSKAASKKGNQDRITNTQEVKFGGGDALRPEIEIEDKESFEDLKGKPSARGAQVINEGDPRLRLIDSLYMQYPEMRDQFKKAGYDIQEKTHMHPESGQIFKEITYPSKRSEIKAFEIGKQPEDIERSKKFSASDVKIYDNAISTVQNVQSGLDNIDYIADIINKSPNFENITGPVSSWLTRWNGSPEDKKLIGEVDSAIGNIMLDAAKNIKGPFTGRDASIINSVKPISKDLPEIFKGKLKAMKLIGEQLKKRNQLTADYIREEKLSPSDAMEKAAKETDLRSLKKDFDKLINKPYASKQLSDKLSKSQMRKISDFENQTFDTREDFLKYLKSLSKEEQDALKLKMSGNS